MLEQFCDDFLAVVPLQLPELLDKRKMEKPVKYDDYVLLTFQLNTPFTIEEVMDMLEDEMEMIILYHHIPSLLRLVAHDADHIEERCKSRTAQLVLLVEQFALGEDSQAVSTCAMFISLVGQIAQSLLNALKRCGINVKQALSQLHYSAFSTSEIVKALQP